MTPPFNPSALSAFRLFESLDLDETRERISAVMQPHRLLPSNHWDGSSWMDFVKIGRLGIGSIAFGRAMHVSVGALDRYYLLMFCLAGAAEVRSRGITVNVDAQRGVLCAPGEEFDATLSTDCVQFVLRIDPHSLAETGCETSMLGMELQLASHGLRAWLQQLSVVTNSTEMLAMGQASARTGRRLEALMLDLLASGHCSKSKAFARNMVLPAYVKKAEAFIRANCGVPLQLEAISREVGVAPRTLRDGFQHYKQTSPMQFVRSVRLEQARERLSMSDSEARIADIALDCGFAHLGRFAIAYRKKFGESPSDTMRMARRGATLARSAAGHN